MAYLAYLRQYCGTSGVEVIAYCLMPNHVHLVVVPESVKGMQHALGAIHGRYAQRLNRMKAQSGHRWQARHFSSPLDAHYFVNAVRYVELNPVRAGIVAVAEDYAWSSASAHCGRHDDSVLSRQSPLNTFAGITDWSSWLAAGIAEEDAETLRRHASQNLPCGSPAFVAMLERDARRNLRWRPPGREREKGDSPV
jgi:putative transposase